MHFCNMDAYYHMATKGDAGAFHELYIIFHKKSKLIIKESIDLYREFSVNSYDFYDLVEETFQQLINDYDSERGSFSTYLEYILSNRFAINVRTILYNYVNMFVPPLEWNGGDRDIDQFCDEDSASIASEITLNSFKQKIASRNKYKTQTTRIHHKIMLLQYAGYKNSEICKILNMTYSQLRTIRSQMQDDEEVINLKLELK